MNRWRIFWLICGLTFLAFSGGAQAQEKYPNRLIELVVPFAPGGSADLVARIYSEDLARELKVTINVVNRPGGSGAQGTAYVIRSKKDGYTLVAAPSTAIIFPPIFKMEGGTYDPLKDLIPLGHFATVPQVWCVRSDSPFKTMDELVEYARNNPGKLKNAAAGIAVEDYIDIEILCFNKKIKISQIPFKGGGEALPALLGGHVDMCGIVISTQGPHIKSGKLRGLAILSKTRHPDFPNIPTTDELGYGSGYLEGGWYGIFAPAGVPQPILNILIPTVEKVFKNPEVGQRAIRSGFAVDYKGPEELRKFVETQMQIVEKVAREANLIKE